MHRINSFIKRNPWEGIRLKEINGSDSLLRFSLLTSHIILRLMLYTYVYLDDESHICIYDMGLGSSEKGSYSEKRKKGFEPWINPNRRSTLIRCSGMQ